MLHVSAKTAPREQYVGFTNMKNTIIIILVFLYTGCSSSDNAQTKTWIHGAWLLKEYIVADRETFLKKRPNGQTPEVACMIFTNDGKIFRLSKSIGRERIYGKFRVNGNVLELCANKKNEFYPMGQLIAPDKLLMDFKKGRKILSIKLPPGTNPESLDLSGQLTLVIESGSQHVAPPDPRASRPLAR